MYIQGAIRMWYVGVTEIETGKLVKEIKGGETEREAERTKRGLDCNLNHDKYYTEVYYLRDK